MKRFFAFSIALSLGLLGTASAQLPIIGGNAAGSAQNRATVRIPGANAANAARVRAGANLDGSRVRLNANSNTNGSVRAGQVGGIRASGQSNTAVELRRRRAQANGNAPQGNAPGQGPGSRASDNEILLRSSLEFRNRLAEIEHMRDVAVQRGDVQLMQRADQLEHALRMRHRISPPQGEVQGQVQHQSQATIQGGQQFNGNVQGQAQGGINNAEARARAEAAGSVNTGNQVRSNVYANGQQIQGEARQQGDASFRAAQRLQNNGRARVDNARGQVDGGVRATVRGTNRAVRRSQAAGDVQIRGNANFSSDTRAGVQGRPVTGSAAQSTQGSGQIDVTRTPANSQSNPPAQNNPAPQQGTPTPPASN